MTRKASRRKGNDAFKITIKAKKGVVAAQTAKFQVSLKKGSFAAALADEGLVGTADAKNASKTVRVDIIFNDATYRKEQVQLYSAKTGKSGATKSPK